MRRAGDVCFAQVFRDGSGNNLQMSSIFLCHYLRLLLLVMHSRIKLTKF